MRLSRKFVWLAADDDTTTHLALKTDAIYRTADVSAAVLIPLMSAGKFAFIDDDPGEKIPDDIVLDVQKGTISMKALLERLDAGLKKEIDNG